MCDCDDNPPTIYEANERTARKPHRCSECRREIAVGERHEAVRGLWDGRWSSFRICAHCRAGANAVERILGEFCWCLGGLWEAARDCSGDGSLYFGTRDARLYRLIAGGRRNWTVRRGPRKGRLMPVPTVPAREPTPLFAEGD